MTQQQGKIQISPFQLYSMMVLFILGVSSVMYFGGEVKQDSWLVVLFSGFIALILFVVIYGSLFLLNKDADNTKTLIENIVGKKLVKVVLLLYAAYFTVVSFFIFRDITELLLTYALPGTPREVIKVVILLGVFYGITHGLESIARSAEIYFWMVVLSISAPFFFHIASGTTELSNIMPIMESDIPSIIKLTPSLFLSIPFGELVIFFFLFPVVNQSNKVIKSGSIALLTTTILLTLTNIFMVITIGPYFAQNSHFPAILMIRIINVANFIQRLDAVYILILLTGSVFQLYLYGFSISRSFQIVFNTKGYNYYYIPIGVIIIIGSFYIGDSYTEATNFGLKKFPYYFNLPFELIIPLLFLIISIIKRLFNKKKSKEQSELTTPSPQSPA